MLGPQKQKHKYFLNVNYPLIFLELSQENRLVLKILKNLKKCSVCRHANKNILYDYILYAVLFNTSFMILHDLPLHPESDVVPVDVVLFLVGHETHASLFPISNL